MGRRFSAIVGLLERPQSPHPSSGVQLTGGNRQIRTTVPPLARGVTPVIVWAGSGGGLLGDLAVGQRLLQITDAGVADLKKALPNCKIVK